jgi:hydrogenase expression/formation protein HypD
MKYLTEFRDPILAQKMIGEIHHKVTQPWAIMEICGGQTHAILRSGLDQVLSGNIELIHGPGCPVCVTSLELIDTAIAIASLSGVIFTSYGDMLRVPGSGMDLMTVRAEGGDVRVVYSPLDALRLAQENPDKEIVFFGIGFETTAPANAMSVLQASRLGISNYSILVSQVRVPPAIEMILNSPANRIQAFLAAGHVCTVMGYKEYLPIAEKYKIPVVVTGFEPLDILLGISKAIELLESSQFVVENAYQRVVNLEGNKPAIEVIQEIYENCDQNWRGIGLIPGSGWRLRKRYTAFDAQKKFQTGEIKSRESEICIAGLILQGVRKPNECQAFGNPCNPENPLGATMVSSEGACAAYYRYHIDSPRVNHDNQ